MGAPGGTTVIWLLAGILAGILGWALADVLLCRAHGNGHRRDGDYCGYCGWGLARTSGYKVYRWEGEVYCSLVCLRQDEGLRERERGLG